MKGPDDGSAAALADEPLARYGVSRGFPRTVRNAFPERLRMTRIVPTLNARVAAVSLVIGAGALHLINQLDHSLMPIRLLTLGQMTSGSSDRQAGI